jgi:hypothetical protein
MGPPIRAPAAYRLVAFYLSCSFHQQTGRLSPLCSTPQASRPTLAKIGRLICRMLYQGSKRSDKSRKRLHERWRGQELLELGRIGRSAPRTSESTANLTSSIRRQSRSVVRAFVRAQIYPTLRTSQLEDDLRRRRRFRVLDEDWYRSALSWLRRFVLVGHVTPVARC